MGLDIIEKDGNTVVTGIKNFDIESILECGQCFRWERNDAGDYTGIVQDKVLRISQADETLTFHSCTEGAFLAFWFSYFDMGTDYGEIIRKLTSADSVMRKAAEFAPGIRILRQPLFETLISFIISANNSIPNIKRVISRLADLFGEEAEYMDRIYRVFPEPSALANADINKIRETKAGFRSPYIKATAELFADNPVTVEELQTYSYEEAKRMLMIYPGVGSKVADCTLLFSGAFTNAFPVDVWVKKIMEEYYLENNTSLQRISEYAENKFRDLGGYAQQYLFYYARSNMKKG